MDLVYYKPATNITHSMTRENINLILIINCWANALDKRNVTDPLVAVGSIPAPYRAIHSTCIKFPIR